MIIVFMMIINQQRHLTTILVQTTAVDMRLGTSGLKIRVSMTSLIVEVTQTLLLKDVYLT